MSTQYTIFLVKYMPGHFQSYIFGVGFGLDLILWLCLGSGLELRTELGLEWYLGLGSSILYQYSGGVHAEIFSIFVLGCH